MVMRVIIVRLRLDWIEWAAQALAIKENCFRKIINAVVCNASLLAGDLWPATLDNNTRASSVLTVKPGHLCTSAFTVFSQAVQEAKKAH